MNAVNGTPRIVVTDGTQRASTPSDTNGSRASCSLVVKQRVGLVGWFGSALARFALRGGCGVAHSGGGSAEVGGGEGCAVTAHLVAVRGLMVRLSC